MTTSAEETRRMMQIPLSKGHFAFVDEADYSLVSASNGHTTRTVMLFVGCQLHQGDTKRFPLHRWLLNAQPGS